MSTKVIAAALIALVLFGGWNFFLYWEKVKNQEETQKKEAAAAAVAAQQLPGLPPALEASLQAATKNGASGLGKWLKTYGSMVQDPRKAVIELDYAMLLSRENPAEARRIYASVRSRTKESSPVWPRIKELEKTYQ